MVKMSLAARRSVYVQATVGVLVLLMALLGLASLRNTATETPEQTMVQLLKSLENMDRYGLIIEEKSTDYRLVFEGIVDRQHLITGSLKDFDLEAKLSDQGLFLRKSGSEEDWQTAEEKNLQGLSGFLTGPLPVLRHCRPFFDQALAGEEIMLEGELCRTVFLVLENRELVEVLFPEINTKNLEELTLGLAFTGDQPVIKQMRLAIKFKGEEQPHLERIYRVSASS